MNLHSNKDLGHKLAIGIAAAALFGCGGGSDQPYAGSTGASAAANSLVKTAWLKMLRRQTPARCSQTAMASPKSR